MSKNKTLTTLAILGTLLLVPQFSRAQTGKSPLDRKSVV